MCPLICMHHQQKKGTPPLPALTAAEGVGEEGPHGLSSRWAGDWPALGGWRGAQGHCEGMTAFTPKPEACPTLSLSHILKPPHPFLIHSIPASLGLVTPLLPFTPFSSTPAFTASHMPTPTFPEGHLCGHSPGLPPHSLRSSTHPTLRPVPSPKGGAPPQHPLLGLVSPEQADKAQWPRPRPGSSPPRPTGVGGYSTAAKHDFGNSF